MDYSFKILYSQAILNFPEKISAGERLGVDYVNMKGRVCGLIEVRNRIDEVFQGEIVPSLVSQLTQVLLGCIHNLLLQLNEIEVKKINPEYVKNCFHELLVKVALPMLYGIVESDGSFDLNEVSKYVLVNKIEARTKPA